MCFSEKIKQCVKNKENNFYYNKNPQLFDELVSILSSVYPNKIKRTIQDNIKLSLWIDTILPQLRSYSIQTKINWIITGRTAAPTCNFCKKLLEINIHSILYVYPHWCSSACRAKDPVFQKRMEDVFEQKYGVRTHSPLGIKAIHEKARNTLKEHYGEHPEKNPIIREKTRQSYMARYGSTHNMKSQKGLEEYKKGMQKKYGVDYTWQVKQICDKAQKTTLERYNVRVTSQSQQAKAKQAQTNLRKYGTISPLQNPEIRRKIEQTNIQKYGVKHYSQNHDVRLRQTYNFYIYDNIMFNSSWEIAFWIYSIENGIKIEREPLAIEYFDSKGEKHMYFPYFRINGNQLIEIKGDDQFNENGKMIDKLNPEKKLYS